MKYRHLSQYSHQKAIFPIAITALTALAMTSAHAQVVWDGDTDSNWSNGLNWVGDVAPVGGDAVSFGGVVGTSPNNDIVADTIISGINLTNDGTVGTNDAVFTLGGNSITLGGNITTTAPTAGTLEDTIALDLVLDANRNINAGSGHNLDITGNISGPFTLSIGPGGGSTKGLITLSGNNTHTQTTFNRVGRVRVESNSALGGSVVMTRGSVITLADSIDLTVASGITVNNGGTPSNGLNLNEDGAVTAAINVATNITNNNTSQSLGYGIGEDDTLTINGVLSGVGQTRKNGLGTLVLTNALNDYTGQMRVLAGTLEISGSAVLGHVSSNVRMNGGNMDLGGTTQTIATLLVSTPAASGDTVHNGSISAMTYNLANTTGNAIISANLLDGSAGVAKTGAGTLTLSGTNTYTGTTTVTAGTLTATAATALSGYNSPGQVIFNGGTLGVQVGGSGWTSGELDDLVSNATKTSGALGIDTTNGSSELASDFSGTIGISKLGANALTLSGDNTYTGNTTLSEGTLNINSATALGDAASSFIIGNGTTIDNTTGSSITLTNNNAISLPSDGFIYGGTQDLDFGTGPVNLVLPPNNTTRVITLNGTGRTLTFGGDSTSGARGGNTNIQVDGAGNTLVFGSLGLNQSGTNRTNTWSGSGNVTVNGGVLDAGVDGGQRFTYAGTGTFTIGGASTFIGNTTVTNGVLALAAGGRLSDDTSVFINGGIIDLAAGVNDLVANLTIVGVNGDAALDDGVYGSTASGATNGSLGLGALDAYLTGEGTFTLDSGTPYSNWAADNGLTEGDNDDETDDPDFDGIANVLEYILGGDPLTSDLTILPVGVINGANFELTFTRSDDSETDAPASVEFGSNLLVFPTASEIVPVEGGTVGDITFTIVENGVDADDVTASIPHGDATEFFGRVSTPVTP